MHLDMVQELDSLAGWFKENVLEIHQAEGDVYEYEGERPNASTSLQSLEEGSVSSAIETAQDLHDELSLIEYIIGVDAI